jgi:hypothetical protein
MRFVLEPDKIYFLILLAFSYLNFKKVDIRGKEQFATTDPEIVTIRRIFLSTKFHSLCRFLVHELVIPGGKPFLRWLSSPWAGNSRRNNHSSGEFLVLEVVLPRRISLYTMLQRTATFAITGRLGWQHALQKIFPTVKVPGFFILNNSSLPKPIFLNLDMKISVKWKIHLIRP